MVYHNYQIIPVSDEDSFLYEVKENLYGLDSNQPFVLGELYRCIEDVQKIKEVDDKEKIKKELLDFYRNLDKFLGEYTHTYNKVNTEWLRRGSPCSLAAQQTLKQKYDEEDRIKEEYLDR